jgi:hypothetical protein
MIEKTIFRLRDIRLTSLMAPKRYSSAAGLL